MTALYDRMLSYVFKAGHAGATFGAIGALDMALWDIRAKLAGEPLWRTLGARDRFVPGYVLDASPCELCVCFARGIHYCGRRDEQIRVPTRHAWSRA